MSDESIVLPSISIAVISSEIITGAIVVVACFASCIFAPESEISSMLLLGTFCGVQIKFIKIFLGLLISILLNIAPNRHPLHFFLPTSCFL